MASEPRKSADPTASERYRQGMGGGRADDPEQDLWQGSYSARSMIDVWVICGVITLVALVVSALYLPDPKWWAVVIGALVLIWVVPLLQLVYRRMAIHYRLTSQRLFHERGILKRVIDRIELIRIDDIAFEQGLFERLITGTGTIRIDSSDRTSPTLILRGIANVREVSQQIDQARRKERNKHGVQVNQV